MTTLLLIRHGHTDANGHGMSVPMVGTTDIPLSCRGKLEADLVADGLASWPAADVVYTSPLARAFETAAAIGQRRAATIRTIDSLGEIDCGIVDGLPLSDVCARYPEAWHQNLLQNEPSFRWPGGESYAEFRERCLAAVRGIAARHGNTAVIVVTHAGVISQVLGYIRGESAACWSCSRAGNASVTEVNWREEGSFVARFDDRRFLAGDDVLSSGRRLCG